MAAAGGASVAGGGSGMRGIVSHPPGIISAWAVSPSDSAAVAKSAAAATNVRTFCIFVRHPLLLNRPAAYDNPVGSCIPSMRRVAAPRGDG
jgi:hypothetical protein